MANGSVQDRRGDGLAQRLEIKVGSQIVFKTLLIIVLIFLAAPLLGAFAMIGTGGRMMVQMPGMVHGGMMGLTTI